MIECWSFDQLHCIPARSFITICQNTHLNHPLVLLSYPHLTSSRLVSLSSRQIPSFHDFYDSPTCVPRPIPSPTPEPHPPSRDADPVSPLRQRYSWSCGSAGSARHPEVSVPGTLEEIIQAVAYLVPRHPGELAASVRRQSVASAQRCVLLCSREPHFL